MKAKSIIALIKSLRDERHKEGSFKYDYIYDEIIEAIEAEELHDQAKSEPKEEKHKNTFTIIDEFGLRSSDKEIERLLGKPKEKKKPIEKIDEREKFRGEVILYLKQIAMRTGL